jgi:phasin family protein
MNNPYAFAEIFKSWLDMNQVFSTQRRNIEAISAANQVMVEGAQAISRRQAEIARDQVEQVLKASRDMLSSGTPETNVTKQADLAKSMFENALINFREITEMATKSGFEAFDLLNKRTAESMGELSRSAQPAARKKAA